MAVRKRGYITFSHSRSLGMTKPCAPTDDSWKDGCYWSPESHVCLPHSDIQRGSTASKDTSSLNLRESSRSPGCESDNERDFQRPNCSTLLVYTTSICFIFLRAGEAAWIIVREMCDVLWYVTLCETMCGIISQTPWDNLTLILHVCLFLEMKEIRFICGSF